LPNKVCATGRQLLATLVDAPVAEFVVFPPCAATTAVLYVAVLSKKMCFGAIGDGRPVVGETAVACGVVVTA
jgi:hypothetical protein